MKNLLNLFRRISLKLRHNKIYLLTSIILYSCCINTASALIDKQVLLYLSAEDMINHAPVESTLAIDTIWSNYRKLEQRWIGEKNTIANHQTITQNGYFAKTDIFDANKLHRNQQVKYFRISYQTNYKNTPHNVSGLVLLPPQNNPRGVILFFHSTITSKLRVPSLWFNEYKTQMLAAIFAANGYVVITPDYVGLGNDYKTEHPYIIYPQVNVNDGYNMLLATKATLAKHNIKFTQDKIPLFVSGYSEGGSYALWFSRIYQQNETFKRGLNQQGYYLQKTVPIEGAYDLSGVMLPFLLANQINEKNNPFNINTTFWGSLLKPSLMINAVLSYANYNNIDIKTLINHNLYRLNCINGMPFCNDLEANYSIDNARLLNANQLKMALNYYFQAYGLSNNHDDKYNLFNNSVKPLINPQLLSESNFYMQIRQADIINWQNNNPTTLISLAADSLVPEANSLNAYLGMQRANSTNLKYIKLSNQLLKSRTIFGPNVVDHVSFELYALLIALQEFNQTQINLAK